MATLLLDNRLSSNFNGLQLQAIGQYVNGSDHPEGIPGRIEIGQGVAQVTLVQGDPKTSLGNRSELIWLPYSSFGEYWYTFEFMVPVTWNYTKPIAIFSVHDIPDNGDLPRHPELGLRVADNLLRIEIPAATLPTESLEFNRAAFIPFKFGEWTKLALHSNWQTTNSGFREVFINGIPYLRQFSIPTHYDDVSGPYAKFGVYDYTAQQDFGILTAYFRNIKMWSGNDGYQTVMGGIPIIPPRMLET